MARINIEESLFKDVRFDDLKMKLGSVDTALGAMVRAWSLAQQWYLKEETSRLIPITEWKKQRISDFIIDVGLAEVRNEGVYVSGSESQFAWLLQRQSAGKKGGRPSNQNKDDLTKGPDKVPVASESGSNPLSLPLSLPLTPISSSDSTSTSSSVKKKVAKTPSPLNKQIWEAYVAAYFARYRVNPVPNAKVNSQIAQLGERLGSEAPEVVRFYLQHNKSYYVSKMHEIGACVSDAESLRTQWLRGKAITEKDVKVFTDNANVAQMGADVKAGGF